MKTGTFIVIVALFFSACDIQDTVDDDLPDFSPISPEDLEAYLENEISESLILEIEDKEEEVYEVEDTIDFMWNSELVEFNSYKESSESTIDSLTSEFDDNPDLVLSEEQAIFAHEIELDSTSLIRDTTFTFISENEEDTTYISKDANQMDSLYNSHGYEGFEQDTITINNFNTEVEAQKLSFERFEGPVEFYTLDWLPDSSFKPTVSVFHIIGNTLLFGAFQSIEESETYDIMQEEIMERYNNYVFNN